jgi:UDP-glucose 4-epimerase
MIAEGKRILITGGTGSLGKSLLRRLLTGEVGRPKQIVVFSRDEAKQHYMRTVYLQRPAATDEVIYKDYEQILQFRIGDVRDYAAVCAAVRNADIVVHAAALKQVPTCEYFPRESVHTNILGPENIVRAIVENELQVETVIGISTDKACQPVNVMGMCKAIQERIFTSANRECRSTRFICVRYGNVLASRGSVIPLFHEQIARGGPVTITDNRMTRFLLSLDQAVDTVFAALREAKPGETYVPRIKSAKVVDVAEVLVGERPISVKVTGIRPGEKIHEVLVSSEECHRTIERGAYYCILPALPELRQETPAEVLQDEFSSRDYVLERKEVVDLLHQHRLLVGQLNLAEESEILR